MSLPQAPAQGMENKLVSKSLLDSFADLDPPETSKFSESNALLSKVLKDKKKREKETEKREQAEADRKRRITLQGDSDGDVAEEEAIAKKAKYEESRAAMQKKIKDHSAPPAFCQCFYPSEEVDAEPELSADNELLAKCTEHLGEKVNFIDSKEMARQLLLGGWFQQHHHRQPDLPAEMQSHLFKLATQSLNAEVAAKAYELLASLICDDQLSDQSLGRQTTLCTGQSFYNNTKPKPMVCAIRDSDFSSALSSLGYRSTETASKAAKPPKEDSAKPAGLPDNSVESKLRRISGWEGAGRHPRLHNLQNLLRLLIRISKTQAEGKGDSLQGGGIQQLFLAVLQLRMDPVCCILATDLEGAAVSLLRAMPERDWVRKFSDTAIRIAAIGGSHLGGVEVIRLLQWDSERVDLLRSHAAAHLLSCLLLPKGKAPKKDLLKSRGVPEPVNPEALVNAQSWFQKGEGFVQLAKNVREGHLSIWELQSTIELVDILTWPFLKEAKDGGAEGAKYGNFISKWHAFAQKLGGHMSKDEHGAAIKLLITTVITKG